MIPPEHALLIPVKSNNDSPDLPNAVEVQFNPATLKVSMANTLGPPPRGGGSRAAQFVDKSSSSLTVDLTFDTTFIHRGEQASYVGRAALAGRDLANVETGSDVRLLTKRIADKFLQPVAAGSKMKAPSRCLFQWGAFEFLGLLQSLDETLDFFSPEGIPLRSTVALKLSEDRYQFRGISKTPAERAAPRLSPASAANQPVPGGSEGPGNWRDNALYNGIESPRLPSVTQFALPPLNSPNLRSSSAGSLAAGLSAEVSETAAAPGFSFGASGRLGTGIAGAFPAGMGGLSTAASASLQATATASRVTSRASVGFD